jgi:hypothetical protein
MLEYLSVGLRPLNRNLEDRFEKNEKSIYPFFESLVRGIINVCLERAGFFIVCDLFTSVNELHTIKKTRFNLL